MPVARDLTNEPFGRLIVIGFHGRVNGRRYWDCLCSCGNTCVRSIASLLNGTQSCGCLRKEVVAARQRLRKGQHQDLSNQSFDRLYVLRLAETNHRKPSWLCLCDCGNTAVVMAQHLLSRSTRSCGCWGIERRRERSTTHGMSGTKACRRAYMRVYSRERAGLSAALDADWCPEMEQALYDFQPACVLCRSTNRLSVDHVRPLSKGHGLVPGNAVRLCGSCNSRKHAKTLGQLPTRVAVKLTKAAAAFQKHWESRTSLALN